MADSNLVQLIQRIAVRAVEAGKPCDYIVGTVVSVSPLQIKVSQAVTLDEEFLHLSRNVTNFEIEFTVDAIGMVHAASAASDAARADRQKITMRNALKVGEKVLMIRKSGGQDYVVVDRVVT